MQTPNSKFDIDALLRDTAQADNQALPFSDWKDALLKEAAAQPAAEATGNAALAFAPPKKRRAVSVRQLTIGLSTVAAALLVVVGLRGIQQPAAAPAPAEAIAAAPAAPPAAFNAESGAGAQVDAIAPQTDAAMLAEAAPMAPEAPAADTAADGVDPAAAEDAPLMQSRAAPGPEELAALHAVQAALGLPEDDGAFAHITWEEGAAYTIAPLEAGAQPRQLESASIYVVVPDTREDGASYAVDAETMQVLGEIVS